MEHSRFVENDGRHALRTWRELNDWTQERLADYLGVVKSAVAHIERGVCRPSLEMAIQIEELTGISCKAWKANGS